MFMSQIDHTAGDLPKGTGKTTTEEHLQAVTVGELVPLARPILIADYDQEWPKLFSCESERIQAALGDRVLLLEHVGSTSVPGLAAKPIIDILLVIADPADEPSYVPAMEDSGYRLAIPEPEWFEHRMFVRGEPRVQVHVLPP